MINPGFVFSAANSEFERQDGFFNGRQDLGFYPTYASLFRQNPSTARQFAASVLGGTPSADNRRDSIIQDLEAAEDVLGLYAQSPRPWGGSHSSAACVGNRPTATTAGLPLT